ncbi:hypothetical protein PLIIFM63780_002756 [Purpureocillium lilacinum]|nr:hypothetical protein PLIIFM63780_002756 [Purpureocillium lilacinum]
MKVSATAVFLATALGVAAHPSGAAHQHMHKRLEFVKAGKPVPAPVKAVVEPSTVASPSAVATPSQAAPSNSGGSGGAGVKSYTPFCGGKKRATLEQINYKGNVGAGGCNMMLASLDVVDKYDYQAIFEETQGKDQKCACWNKMDANGDLKGFFKTNPNALYFDLPAKSKQAVVFDGNSQGGCSCRVGKMTYTPNVGMFDGTWFEFDFGNESNKKWSGADASSLAAHDDGGTVTAMTVECGLRDGSYSDKSIINADGSGTNSFTAGKNAEDGHGCNIPAGPAYAKIQV